ncbi:hypothetical protein PUN28_012515 [Cardiocondyla obscurior]|uniref:acid phosphatase n=1 Tax=Cardiocondyla obscurior TaxID=286306 RepID=A0AAW2FDV2_9HYME
MDRVSLQIFLQTFFLLSLFVSLGRPELNLESLQVLMRHGERTPRIQEMYPTDPYNLSTYEPWGLAQLTNKGKLTEFKIGTMLRQRYKDFLESISYPQDIYAISSDSLRTKMSLQLMLAGLFPPNTSLLWNPNLLWLPMPTYHVPKKLDILFKSENCPIYKEAIAETKKLKEIQDQFAVYEDLYKFVNNKTGKINENILDLYNLLTAQKNMNLTLPEWCTNNVYLQMQQIVVLEYKIRSYTTLLKRLNGGMFIKRFIENLNKHSNPRKIYAYCGHDTNIAGFARAQNISKPRLPDYGSAFLIEKLRDDSDKLFIKILFWTGVTEKLIVVKVPGCDEICPLETYLELVRDVIPLEEEISCFIDNINRDDMLELFTKDRI